MTKYQPLLLLTMKQVLDILIIEFSDNLEAALKKIQPLTVLMPPLAIPSIEDVYSISSLCPGNLLSDPAYLFAELETYISTVDFQPTLKSLANAAEDSFNKRS